MHYDYDAEPAWLVQYYEGQGTDTHITGFDAFYSYVEIAEEGSKIQNIWPDTGNEQFDAKLPCWTEEEGLLDNDGHYYYDDFYSDFDDIEDEVEESLNEDANLINAKVADVEYNDDDGYDRHVLLYLGDEDKSEEEIEDDLTEQGMIYVYVNDIFEKEIPVKNYNLYDVVEVYDVPEGEGVSTIIGGEYEDDIFTDDTELNEGIIFSDKAIKCQVKDLLDDPLGKLILSRLQAGREGNGPYRLSDEELEILKDEYIYYEDDGDCYYARFEKPTAEIRKILNLSPQSDNPFLVHEYYNIANGSDSIIEEYALNEWETAGADNDWTDFPEEVLEKFIQILDRDYIWDLANEMVGWTCYDEDSDEELKEAANAILAYYKNDNKDFCDLLTRIDDEYRAKDYDEDLTNPIKKIYYYIQGEGDDFEEYMLPLLACYYYDKPGKYKIDFSNRQFGSEYKALVEIIGDGTFRIIKRD